MENNLNRTCELKTSDILYISPMHMHVSNVNITDEMALKCLENGWLKPECFKTLPENYKVVTHADILDVPAKPLRNKKAE